ncbi:MAG: VWA domain-containing protein [Alphaproteobacteria bacterium]|nr:VWA domain-containing protein [Alphaproteobacteria bacterium]
MLARTIRTVALIVCVLVGLVGSGSAQEQPDIMILFDQSGSVGKHDPKLASKAWLLTFLETFDNPYKIEIVGFDEALYRHLAVERDTATDIKALNQAIDEIEMAGKATDLEMPFRYLLNFAKTSTKLAIIISDGEPEIWDAKLGYLSKEVQADPRYDDLNRQYRQMKDAGVSKRTRFEKLGALYHARNVELIESQLPGIANLIGDRLIIWDLSGTSYYLKTWAKAAGAQYLPMRVAAQESPVEQLQKAMTALQRQSSAIVNEALPDDHEHRAAVALTAIPEIAAKVQDHEHQAAVALTAIPEIAAKVQPEEMPAPPVEPKAPEPAPLQPVAPPPSRDGQPSSWLIVLVLLGGAAGAYAFFRRRAPVSSSAKAGPAIPLDLASQYIDAKVKNALDDAEKLRRKLLVNESGAVNVERRFSLRVSVPPGAMEVQWIGEDGDKRETPAIDISMHGVKFETYGAGIASVTAIICPKMEAVLAVKKFEEIRRDGSRAVALLIEFDNNLDDWMRWVEIITRIDEAVTK